MQEINIISLIESYGVELVAGGLTACVAAIVMRNVFGLSAKICLVFAFGIGAAITFLTEYFAFQLAVGESLDKAVTAGAIAVVLTSFTKKLAFMDKEDVKSNIEKLLSSIVLSDELDKVVNEIVEKIRRDSSVNEDSVKEVIRSNVDADIDENTLDLVAKFILKALNGRE